VAPAGCDIIADRTPFDGRGSMTNAPLEGFAQPGRDSHATSAEPPVASAIRRFAAALAGAVVLVFCSTFTLGTVLAAPIGVLAARALARRGQRRLTRAAAWFAAVLASFIAVPIVFGVLLAKAPDGTIESVRAVMDSAQAQQKQPELPEWLQRISPPGAQQQNAATQKLVSSRPFVVVFGIIGALMVCSVFGTIAGSIGWVASLLLAYTLTGRWISGAQPPPELTTAEL
jgi:predicted PurR-regulated permease PerM